MALTLRPLPTEQYVAWRAEVAERRAASPRSRGVPADVALGRAREAVDRVLPADGPPVGTDVLAVEGGARPVGTLFLLPGEGTVQLGELRLDDPADAPVVRGLLVELLRGRGATALGVLVTTGDPVMAAFVDGAGGELVATQMQLDLATPATALPAPLRTRVMTAEEVATYFAGAVEAFAAERRTADPSLTEEQALAGSRAVHEQVLPQGPDTPGHDFLVGLGPEEGARVGILWLFHEHRAAYVYDVAVDAAERGRGHGRALMGAAAGLARQRGAVVLGLNVFGHNATARSLYDSMGFEVVDEALQLPLNG